MALGLVASEVKDQANGGGNWVCFGVRSGLAGDLSLQWFVCQCRFSGISIYIIYLFIYITYIYIYIF